MKTWLKKANEIGPPDFALAKKYSTP